MRDTALALLLLACGASLSGCWWDRTPTQADAASQPPEAGTIADAGATDAAPVEDSVADFQVFAEDTPDAAADGAPDATAPPAWFACAQPADCSAVEIACCDHCNGGKLMAANTSYAAEVKAMFGAKNCAGVACTLMACAFPPTVECQAGQCAIGKPVLQCDALAEAPCKATTGCMANYGRPYLKDCFGMGPGVVQAEFLGCSKAQPCPQAFGCAVSPTGEMFNTFQLCAPAGWTFKPGPDCCQANCKPAEPARLCVRGTPGSQGETLAVGDEVKVTVQPKGCWSSSCTKAVSSWCSIKASPGDLSVAADFCLADTSNGGACTADCGGGGFASCGLGPWTAGTAVVHLGALKVTVQVPSVLPFGGACAGSPF